MRYKASIVIIISLAFLFLDVFFLSALSDNKGYSLSPLSSISQEKGSIQINLNFISPSAWHQNIPEYDVQEIFDLGETKIVFHNVDSAKTQFDYAELANNPLIDDLDYHQEGRDFVLEIRRKGAFLPSAVTQDGSFVIIRLKEGDENYPVILAQKPADNSAAYPAFRKIIFEADLKDPLEKASVLFQNKPVEFSSTKISQNKYLFEFKEEIQKDKQYWVKAIVSDRQGRTIVNTWTFQGQIFIEAALGPDRFKYLGWWGRVNADGVSVRVNPGTKEDKLGTFSSLNRVKVLKEVIGESINDNNLWYQIDGGQYPAAFVFSDYISPMVQPEAPKEFNIPKEVENGEYWIDVNLTRKVLTLFSYDKPVFATYISPGREENPTATGTYRVWYKLKKARMQGGPPLHTYKYDLPDVPNVLYYNESYAIHGTYWHDKFETPQSAGCTNLTQGDAAFIFSKVNPRLGPDQEAVFSSRSNPGTVVFNHF